MEENKKSGFFRQFMSGGKNKASQEAEATEGTEGAEQTESVESTETIEPEKTARKPQAREANTELTKEEIEQQNKRDSICQLYDKWSSYQGRMPSIRGLFGDWVKTPAVETIEQMGLPGTALQKAEIFRKQMMKEAEKTLRDIEAAEDEEKKRKIMLEDNPDADIAPIQLPPDIDAAIHVQIPVGRMEAFVMVLPPFGNGAELDYEGLIQALTDAEVINGMRSDIIDEIANKQQYFKIFLVATGTPPIAGEDGSVVEHVPREEPLTFKEDEHGRVDYKEQNLFRRIEKGDLICDIIAPKEGTDGIDVKGNVLKAAKGKNAIVPAGESTTITEDGSQLVADCNGYISYVRDKFRVADRLVIHENVDMSVGNQDFLGDIIVYGDVISGFTLKATGNILVKGAIEGAILEAGGNIEIGDGMNGNNFGELHAGGYVRSPFLENVKIFAGEDIFVKSMISCEAHSERDICINEGIGVVIGGTLMAGRSVSAKIIGSKARRKTEIILGVDPEVQEKKAKKKEQLEKTEATRSLLERNLELLKTTAEMGGLTEEQNSVLRQLEEQEALYRVMVEEQQADFEEFKKKVSDYSECVLHCNTIFPPATVTIAESTYLVGSVITGSKFYYTKDGEVQIAPER